MHWTMNMKKEIPCTSCESFTYKLDIILFTAATNHFRLQPWSLMTEEESVPGTAVHLNRQKRLSAWNDCIITIIGHIWDTVPNCLDLSCLDNFILKFSIPASARLGETTRISLIYRNMRQKIVQHCVKISKKVKNRTSGVQLYHNHCKNVTHGYKNYKNKTTQYTGPPSSVALVRERTIPTERPPPVGEVSSNFCGEGCHVVSTTDPHGR